jgi:hypothetical protein
MNFSDLWAKITRGKRADEGVMPFSVVLLLRQPPLFTKANLEAAGERAWHRPFSNTADSMYCVVEATPLTFLIKSGAYLFSLLQEESLYLGPMEDIAPLLPREEQRIAWRQHTVWTAIDLMNQDVPKNEAYAALANWALALADSNCCGIYLPREQVMMPNDGPAEEGLRKLKKKGSSERL